ncbi:HNH endonuclease [Gordonia phage Phendrix]|uniref:HNH endonuclease n=1 Tax=Gordonia phage Phendrix TaxID=2593335 RepID=A0A514U0Z0_9CAUD|nr:HNH endonuclease [Gordonia phage Phendrix]QDK02601.1 HNH endonuclease [Gordonia phage Phendrix]
MVKKAERRNDSVLLLNVDYTALETITWQRAIVLLVLGEAEMVDPAVPHRVVHSQHLEVVVPKTVRLNRYVHIVYDIQMIDEGSSATLPAVLRRDKNVCGYCGDFATTVDHIFPQSRGGPNTWGNLIAACFDCNNLKDNRTPEEAGMKLLWPPKAPKFDEVLQKHVWRDLK